MQERTDEDVGHGALVGLLEEVVLNLVTFIEFVQSAQGRLVVQSRYRTNHSVLKNLSLCVRELGGQELLGAFAVRAPSLGEDGNGVARDSGLRRG